MTMIMCHPMNVGFAGSLADSLSDPISDLGFGARPAVERVAIVNSLKGLTSAAAAAVVSSTSLSVYSDPPVAVVAPIVAYAPPATPDHDSTPVASCKTDDEKVTAQTRALSKKSPQPLHGCHGDDDADKENAGVQRTVQERKQNGLKCDKTMMVKMKLKCAITIRKRKQEEEQEENKRVCLSTPADSFELPLCAFDRRAMRMRLLQTSFSKIQNIVDPESNMLRTVLISNTILRVQADALQEYKLQQLHCDTEAEPMDCSDSDSDSDSDDDEEDYDDEEEEEELGLSSSSEVAEVITISTELRVKNA